MKKIVFGAAAATLMLLSACSTDEIAPAMADSEELTPEQLANVEVELSARNKDLSAQVTRAAILGGEETDIDGLGIFGLARVAQDVNNSPDNVNWFGNTGNWSGCILNNVKSNKVGHDIEWDDPTARYFYPVSQFYSYDFYGYYPYLTAENLRYEPTKVTANYVIDGTQDLIWGRATDSEKYAYSAKYFRVNNGANENKIPNVALQHLLTRFVFVVVPGESYDGSGDYGIASLMQVDTLQVVDTYTNLSVTIADLDNLDMPLADRIYPTTWATDTITLCDVDTNGDKVPLAPLHLGNTPVETQLGESVMLFSQGRYTIRMALSMDAYQDEKGNQVEAQKFITEIPLQLVADTIFKQGVSYKVKITVHGPRAVSLAATLEPWQEEDGPELEL